jgi:hypothetical protein
MKAINLTQRQSQLWSVQQQESGESQSPVTQSYPSSWAAVMKRPNNATEMGDYRSSKSQTSRFTNFEHLLYFDPVILSATDAWDQPAPLQCEATTWLHGHHLSICKHIHYNSLVEGSMWVSWDARGVPVLWASTNWHMPLDMHQHLCCANSQTAVPHHVSSRTHPLRLRTPAEHLTRLYLPAEGTRADMTWVTYIHVHSIDP